MPRSDAPAAAAVVRFKLVKSPIGYNARQRATVQSLGLRKLHQVAEQPDTPAVRGMLARVRHLVQIVEG